MRKCQGTIRFGDIMTAATGHLDDAAAATGGRGWPLVVGLATAQLASWGILYYAFSVVAVPMEQELGWSRVQLNGALTLGLLVSGLAAYEVGSWIDRHGGRMLMGLGTALGSLSLAAWSQVESLLAFYAIWACLGLALSMTLYEPVFAVLTRLYSRTYRSKITAVTLLGGFASTVFIPATQFLVLELGWRDALLLLAGVNAAIGLPVHLGMLRDAPGATAGDTAPPDGRAMVRRALGTPTFWGLLLCLTTHYAVVSALAFHLVPLLGERGLSPVLSVAVFSVIGPAQVAGRVATLAAGRRLSTAALGRLVTLLFPAAVAVLALAPASVPAAFAFAGLYGAAIGTMTIVRGTAVPDLMWREGYGAVNGALALPSAVARAGGPFAAAGIWATGAGYQAVLWTCFACGVVSALGFWYAARGKR